MLKANELIYKKIEHHIRSQIEDGALHAGDRMLSEREIARQFKSSVVTVRKAMKPLIDSGIIEKIHGKGTFIKQAIETAETGRLAVVYGHSRAGLFASSFYMSIISGIEGATASTNKNMMLCSLLRDDPAMDPAAVIREMAQQTDGIIVVDPTVNIYGKIEPALLACRVPVVVLNNGGVSDQLDAVVPDNARDTHAVIEFLAGLGHRRIACASYRTRANGDISFNFNERINAYYDAMRDCGLPVDDALFLDLTYDKNENDATLIDSDDLSLFREWQESADRFNKLLDGPDPVSAVYCTSDERALFLYKLARQRGLRIPEDLSIVGYDDMMEAAMVRPGLTTVHTPLHEMGATAVKRLMEKIGEKKLGAESHYRITLPGKLVKRESHKIKA